MSGTSIRALILAALLLSAMFLSGCAHRQDDVVGPAEVSMEESIVFFGDSITYLGSWESWFAGHKVTNLGISGDNVGDLIDRVGDVVSAKPTKLFVMVGVNDILSGHDPADVIKEHEKLLDMLKEALPQCEIYVESVLPVSRDMPHGDLILSYNVELKALSERMGLKYIELFTLYRDKSGYLLNNYTGDGLHLLRDAYAPWVNEIRPIIDGE